MIFGIRYESKLKNVNKNLETMGSAIIMRGKCNVYFKSLALAFFVTQNKNQNNSKLKYSVYKLSEKQEQMVNPQRLVESFSEYEELKKRDAEEFKKELKSLTEQEQ